MNPICVTPPAARAGMAFIRWAKIWDMMAASPLVVWYGAYLYTAWDPLVRAASAFGTAGDHFLNLMVSASKALAFAFGVVLIVLLVARKTPIKRSQGAAPQLIAFLACYVSIGALVLPVSPSRSALAILSTPVIFGGSAFALYSLLWLGRSISIMPESRKLVTGGPYSMVRHPLYLGEQTVLMGLALQCTSIWPLLVLALQLALQLYRIGYEERILTETFPEYAAYSRRTARLIPWLF